MRQAHQPLQTAAEQPSGIWSRFAGELDVFKLIGIEVIVLGRHDRQSAERLPRAAMLARAGERRAKLIGVDLASEIAEVGHRPLDVDAQQAGELLELTFGEE